MGKRVAVNPKSLLNLKPKSAEWLREHKIHLNHPHSELSKNLISKNRKGKLTGETNHKWKGDKVGYSALHAWVYRKLGKPNICDACGDTEASRYNWASKSRLYLRELSDWIRLCSSCHSKFDKIRLEIRTMETKVEDYRRMMI